MSLPQKGRNPGLSGILRDAPIAVLFTLLVCAVGTRMQSADQNAAALFPSFLVRAEAGQRLEIGGSGKHLATDQFRLTAGSESLCLTYTSHPPIVLDRLKFQALPFGYRLAGLSLKRPWGALTAFRSTGFGSGRPPALFARRVTGAAVEVPKRLFSTDVSAYFLHASGEMPTGIGPANNHRDASQAGVEVSRALMRGFRFRAEWTRFLGKALSGPQPPARRDAYHVALTGESRWIDSSLIHRDRGGGYATAAVAAPGQAARTTTLVLQRSLKQHLLSYSARRDAARDISNGWRITDGRNQESLRWTFSPKSWPGVSAVKTWSSHESPGRRETEEGSGITISKTAGPLSVSLLRSRSAGTGAQPGGGLWRRKSCGGDIALTLFQKRRLELHLERGRWLPGSGDTLEATNLQMSTTLAAWGERIVLAPVFSYQSQSWSRNPANARTLALVVSAQIRLPRRIPGTDLAVAFSDRRSEGMTGVAARNATIALRWNFKSF